MTDEGKKDDPDASLYVWLIEAVGETFCIAAETPNVACDLACDFYDCAYDEIEKVQRMYVNAKRSEAVGARDCAAALRARAPKGGGE